jgi:hypothetical protein
MSTKDLLSVPIMSVNFPRFVSCVGPMFWLQDRIEDIVMWEKGWKVTCVAIYLWLLLYVSSPNGPTRIHSCGLGYFPQLILCLPHISLISIILATYPYPASNTKTAEAYRQSCLTSLRLRKDPSHGRQISRESKTLWAHCTSSYH